MKNTEEKIMYYTVSSAYKDYVKVMLGDTEIIYVKTTKENFDFIEQELKHMAESINLVPTLVSCLKKLRGVEAWITPNERHLMNPVYEGIEEFEKTAFAKYTQQQL